MRTHWRPKKFNANNQPRMYPGGCYGRPFLLPSPLSLQMEYYRTGSGHVSGRLEHTSPRSRSWFVFSTATNVGGVKWLLTGWKFEFRSPKFS